MSAAPTKSQSFRGFSSLPFPTWGTQASDVEPKVETEAEKSSSSAAIANRGVGSRSSRQQRFSFSSLAPSSVKSVEENHQGLRDAAAMEEKPTAPPRREEVPAATKEVNGVEGEEEEVKRTWNLRPRKGYSGSRKNNGVFSPEVCGGGNGNGNGHGGASETKQQKSVGGMEPKSNRLRGLAAESPGLGVGERKNEKPRLWVALSRDEIEEDIFSMSGNRPSRRPRKRPKTVQKHLDGVFPGLCLVGMNSDNFRIPDTPAKR